MDIDLCVRSSAGWLVGLSSFVVLVVVHSPLLPFGRCLSLGGEICGCAESSRGLISNWEAGLLVPSLSLADNEIMAFQVQCELTLWVVVRG